MGSVSSCCQSQDKDEEREPLDPNSAGSYGSSGPYGGYGDSGGMGSHGNSMVNGGRVPSGAGRNQGRPDLLDHSQGQLSGQYGHYDLAAGGQKFEQNNALNRVLHQMASNVIDVNMIDATPIEQQEWFERQRTYQTRINQIRTPLLLKSSLTRRQRQQLQPGSLGSKDPRRLPNRGRDQSSMKDQPQSSLPSSSVLDSQLQSSLLNISPISESDIKLIEEYCDRTVEAMKSFTVVSEEPLVVQFSP